MQIASLLWEGWRGPTLNTSLELTRIFQTGCLRLHFWCIPKLQLGREPLAQVTPYWVCGFLF